MMTYTIRKKVFIAKHAMNHVDHVMWMAMTSAIVVEKDSTC